MNDEDERRIIGGIHGLDTEEVRLNQGGTQALVPYSYIQLPVSEYLQVDCLLISITDNNIEITMNAIWY